MKKEKKRKKNITICDHGLKVQLHGLSLKCHLLCETLLDLKGRDRVSLLSSEALNYLTSTGALITSNLNVTFKRLRAQSHCVLETWHSTVEFS